MEETKASLMLYMLEVKLCVVSLVAGEVGSFGPLGKDEYMVFRCTVAGSASGLASGKSSCAVRGMVCLMML